MINAILTAAGIPYRRGRFQSPPAGTYAVFFDNVSVDGADPVTPTSGGRLPGVRHHNIMVEVYEPRPDDAVEDAIEAKLTAQGLAWDKQDRHWLQDVQRYQVIYEFSYTTKNT